jgi:hypothetical protein
MVEISDIIPKNQRAKRIGLLVYSLKNVSNTPNPHNTRIASIIKNVGIEAIHPNTYFAFSYF